MITGPSAPTLPPSVGVLRNPRIRSSLTRVVKVLGTACGAGVEGSGWFARRDLVVTAAHVVAGERSTIVEIPGDPNNHAATVVLFDAHNDIAILRLSDATEVPLRLADPQDGASVAIVGYPLDGNLTAIAGRVGRTANAFTQDALGGGPVVRAITAVAGRVDKGNSGGPVIDTRGAVEATIFAKKRGSRSGYAVPTSIVRTDLANAGRHAVSTASCVPTRARQKLDDVERLAERRHHVDAVRDIARVGDQLPPELAPDFARVGTGRRVPLLHAARGRRCRAPRCGRGSASRSCGSARRPRAPGSGHAPPRRS